MYIIDLQSELLEQTTEGGRVGGPTEDRRSLNVKVSDEIRLIKQWWEWVLHIH